MALGKKQTQNGKLLILKIKTQDEDKKPISPCFQVSEKVNGKYEKRSETVTAVSGNLIKLEIREQEYKGDKYNTISIYLVDGEEVYLIDTRVNMLTRSLYNSLLSLKTFENISISLYNYKKTDKKTNKEVEYPAVAVRQNDEIVKWAVALPDQPKPASITFKGKTQNDYTEVDNFFVEKIRQLATVVEASTKNVNKPSTTDVAAATGQVKENEDENVPF